MQFAYHRILPVAEAGNSDLFDGWWAISFLQVTYLQLPPRLGTLQEAPPGGQQKNLLEITRLIEGKYHQRYQQNRYWSL